MSQDRPPWLLPHELPTLSHRLDAVVDGALNAGVGLRRRLRCSGSRTCRSGWSPTCSELADAYARR